LPIVYRATSTPTDIRTATHKRQERPNILSY
jgi:hypothetical protein